MSFTDYPIVRFSSALALAAALALGTTGCGDDLSPPILDDDELLAPPAAGEGVQFRMQTVIDAGVEAEHCMFIQAPADGLFVNRDEVRYSRGSHHFLLYMTAYSAIPERKDDGTSVDTSGVFDCSDGATNGWSVVKLIGGSQNADGDSMLAFPSDVAIRVPPGAVLLMNAHYVNASDEPLEPEVAINLYTIPEQSVRHEGDLLFLYNPLIRVGANGTGRARMRCPVYEEITLVNAQSHMHARGVGYAAMLTGQEPFYVNDRWEDVPITSFEESGGLVIPAGASIDYFCDYANGEDRDVYQGPRSTDEMCMLIGSYYPANAAIANCATEDGTQFAAEWVGEGEATCAETLACVQGAFAAPDPFQALTVCMLAASPEVSRESSDVVLCLFAGGDPEGECADPIAACLAR